MPDNSQAQSLQEDNDQNQHVEDLMRQDYGVRVSGGQTLVVPNVFEGAELPLAKMHKPDVSIAVDMPGGVSIASL